MLLALFIISFAIPSFLIYRYALIDSVKTIIWITFQFGLLFAFDCKKDSQHAKKELDIVSMAVASFPVDAVASATPMAAEKVPSLLTLLLGNYGGAIGETCTLALILGGIYLIARRVITWHIPVVFIGTVFVFSLFMEGFDVTTALSLVMAGGLFIGAIFMATDYVTSPSTAWGKVIFALGAGFITCLIRYFGNYPEGVSFAILFMNILTPYIDQWTKHKVFATEGGRS